MGALGFGRGRRLLSRGEFTACYEQGHKRHTRLFLVFTRDSGLDRWRLGLAVSRKLGSAVRRNRIKRLLREFFRLRQPLPAPCLDLVVVPKRHVDADTLTLAAVSADLDPALRRIVREAAQPPLPSGAAC